MTPDWLKEIEDKPIIRDGTRYYSGKQIDQLLSAIKLAMEGLEKIQTMGFRVNLDIPGAYDFNTTGKIAREILEKIKSSAVDPA